MSPPPNSPPIHVVLRLSGASTTIEGVVHDETGTPASGARMIAPSEGDNENEVYVTRADSGGHYSFTLPAGPAYFVIADAPPRPRKWVRVKPTSHGADLTLEPPPAPRPSDAEIVAWLHAHATALAPGEDLDPAQSLAFDTIVGDAQLVGMGEATHGSIEFPEWKRRVFEALVRDKGFTVFAVEAGWPDTLALDDYVVTGRGDPIEAIHAVTGWPAGFHALILPPSPTRREAGAVQRIRLVDLGFGHARSLPLRPARSEGGSQWRIAFQNSTATSTTTLSAAPSSTRCLFVQTSARSRRLCLRRTQLRFFTP